MLGLRTKSTHGDRHTNDEHSSQRRSKSRSKAKRKDSESRRKRRQGGDEARDKPELRKKSASKHKTPSTSFHCHCSRCVSCEECVDISSTYRSSSEKDQFAENSFQNRTVDYKTGVADIASERRYKDYQESKRTRVSHCGRERKHYSPSPNTELRENKDNSPRMETVDTFVHRGTTERKVKTRSTSPQHLKRMTRHQRRKYEERRSREYDLATSRLLEEDQVSSSDSATDAEPDSMPEVWNIEDIDFMPSDSESKASQSSQSRSSSRGGSKSSSSILIFLSDERDEKTHLWGFDKYLQPHRRVISSPKGILSSPASKRAREQRNVSFAENVSVIYLEGS